MSRDKRGGRTQAVVGSIPISSTNRHIHFGLNCPKRADAKASTASLFGIGPRQPEGPSIGRVGPLDRVLDRQSVIVPESAALLRSVAMLPCSVLILLQSGQDVHALPVEQPPR